MVEVGEGADKDERVEGQEESVEDQLANSLTYVVFGQMSPSVRPLLKTLLTIKFLHPQYSCILFYFFLCHVICHLLTYYAIDLLVMFTVHCLPH